MEELNAVAAGGMDYAAYRALVAQVVAEQRTTGPDQSAFMVQYTALNKVRMDRNERTVELLPELEAPLRDASAMTWLVLSEAWCGDAAQCVPVLDLLVRHASAITLRIVLRDGHVELMDRYLTRGTRSIPKLIAFDAEGRELFNWGPRPAAAQVLIDAQRTLPEAERLPKEKLYEQLHGWYAKDRGVAVQREFLALLTGADPGQAIA